MDIFQTAFDFLIHIDQYIAVLVEQYGALSYGIIFLIVFFETGLVVMPFLPGDSLLFAVGTLAAGGVFSLWLLIPGFIIAAILGDALNYWIGVHAGEKMLASGSRFLKPEHIERTRAFYDKYGGKAVVISRFVPLVRTIAPFIAGVGRMNYSRFTFFNVLGALIWVPAFVLGGYFFGSIPTVQRNFGIIIVLIVVISLLPGIIEIVRARRIRTGANPDE